MSIKKCECCEAELSNQNLWTVCKQCDADIEKEESVELTELEIKWAAKHKCRTCDAGLPISRYFDCLDCKPAHVVETESEFDSFDDVDSDIEEEEAA